MLERKEPVLSNIKFHFAVSRYINLLEKLENIEELISIKWKTNFAVFKDNRTSFILFFNCGFVNVTGIKSFSEISKTLDVFCILLNISRNDIGSISIDNLTSSGSFGHSINLTNLQQYIKFNQADFKVHRNISYFPGLFCKHKSFGTIIIFQNGSFTLIGSKCLNSRDQLFSLMDAIIPKL